MNNRLRYILLVLLFATSECVFAQTDSVAKSSITLEGITVKGYKQTLHVKSTADGNTVWNMDMLNNMPKVLGASDPLHYAQMLPGIQTNGEYRGGINIQGCDNSHNEVSIAGAPIYNVAHLLGFFSIFNTTHYPTLNIRKSTNSADNANRLGGGLTMDIQEVPIDSFSADASVGLIFSQGTIRLPLGKNTSVIGSLRSTYINLLYGPWLRTDEMNVKYSFFDGNFTLIHRFNNRNTLIADYYGGNDDATFNQNGYTVKLNSRWGNQMGALHHLYEDDDISLRNSLYVTHTFNHFHVGMQEFSGHLPSAMTDYAYKGLLTWKRLTGGMQVIEHVITPQYVLSTGSFVTTNVPKSTSHTLEASLFADYRQPLCRNLSLSIGLRGNLYGSEKTVWFHNIDPIASLVYDNRTVQVYANYALRHQYLFQTGFSDIGLPTEFWISADKNYRPQYAHSFMFGSSVYLLNRRFKIDANVFYKRLFNQMEYIGTILDFANTEYKFEDCAVQGSGRNYGFSFMLSKCYGNLSGWISYTYTHAHRHFNDTRIQGEYPANHERPHEFNAVGTYRLNRHWDFGVTAVYASGTPYTAPLYFAMVNSDIIAKYGKHNGSRMSNYFRCDLSVNYKWECRFAKENGINISLYNATCHHNKLFYTLQEYDDNTFAYVARSFAAQLIPSVSYFCKF